MPKVELTKEQIQGLFQIVSQAQFSGKESEFVTSLKVALAKPIQEQKIITPKKEIIVPKK